MEQQRVDDGEYGGVCANAQTQGEHGESGEDRRSPHAAPAIAEIAQDAYPALSGSHIVNHDNHYINKSLAGATVVGMKPLNDPPKGRPRGGPPGRFGAAFLLAQVGAHAAWRFAARLAALELAPPDVGILRIRGAQPAITQQALASALGMPSRLVALVDELRNTRAGRAARESRRSPQPRPALDGRRTRNAGVERTRGTRTPAGAARRAQ